MYLDNAKNILFEDTPIFFFFHYIYIYIYIYIYMCVCVCVCLSELLNVVCIDPLEWTKFWQWNKSIEDPPEVNLQVCIYKLNIIGWTKLEQNIPSFVQLLTPFLLAWPCWYIMKSGFSHVHNLLYREELWT